MTDGTDFVQQCLDRSPRRLHVVEAYVDQLFSAPAQPTDEEVARYYEQHRTEFVRDGRQLSLDDARDLARERATAARRQVLVAGWLSRLWDRTTVVNMFRPPR